MPAGSRQAIIGVGDVSPKHRSAIADLSLCSDENQVANRLATTLIAVRTPVHCRLTPTNPSAKGRLPILIPNPKPLIFRYRK
ncbi:MAG: hypothetical protein LBC02_07755 [Planctomycetaceae bacterium]|nr:hypothetical protein [Planctomycetaceae bacterium]